MRQRRLMNQINVVPYIDVMLVLLVIFMVAAPMMQHGSVAVPNISAQPPPPDKAMHVVVEANQQFSLRRTPAAEKEAVSDLDLQRTLSEILAENPEQRIVVEAERSVPYEDVKKALDHIRAAGFPRAGLLTQ